MSLTKYLLYDPGNPVPDQSVPPLVGNSSLFNRRWWLFFQKLVAGAASIAPDTVGPATPFTLARETWGFLTLYYTQPDDLDIDTVRLLALSVDETDPSFQVVLTMDAVTPQPTVTPLFPTILGVPVASRFGKQFAVGTYLIANDPQKFFINSNFVYVYEIVKIVAILASGDWVIERTPAGAPVGQGQFGSLMSAHLLGGGEDLGAVFFPLTVDPRVFPRENWTDFTGTDPGNNLVQRWEWAYPNKCVAVVQLQADSAAGLSPVYMQNLAIVDALGDLAMPRIPPHAPGLRTLNGNQYDMTISGPLTVGANADIPIRMAGWEGVRCAVAELLTATTGPCTIDLTYTTPDLLDIGLVDTFDFTAPGGGEKLPTICIPHPSQGRDRPYHAGEWTPTLLPAAPVGQQDWPANVLPRMAVPDPITHLPSGPAMSNGRPVVGYILDPAHSIVMEENGRLDLLVTVAAGGADLLASLRT